MSEYIISDEQLRSIYLCGLHNGQNDDPYDDFYDSLIEREAAEITRCRDCDYGKAIEQIGCLKFDTGERCPKPKVPNGYCAWAKPKEEA